MEGSGIEIDLFRLHDNPGFITRLQQLRLKLFSQINETVFYGKGGYDFDTIYTMPIWLRHFIYKEMVRAYKKEAEAAEKANSGESQTLKKTQPLRVPDYSVKGPAR